MTANEAKVKVNHKDKENKLLRAKYEILEAMSTMRKNVKGPSYYNYIGTDNVKSKLRLLTKKVGKKYGLDLQSHTHTTEQEVPSGNGMYNMLTFKLIDLETKEEITHETKAYISDKTMASLIATNRTNPCQGYGSAQTYLYRYGLYKLFGIVDSAVELEGELTKEATEERKQEEKRKAQEERERLAKEKREQDAKLAQERRAKEERDRMERERALKAKKAQEAENAKAVAKPAPKQAPTHIDDDTPQLPDYSDYYDEDGNEMPHEPVDELTEADYEDKTLLEDFSDAELMNSFITNNTTKHYADVLSFMKALKEIKALNVTRSDPQVADRLAFCKKMMTSLELGRIKYPFTKDESTKSMVRVCDWYIRILELNSPNHNFSKI